MTEQRKWLAVAIVTLLLGVAIGYGISRIGASDSSAHSASMTESGNSSERKVLYWHDPMVPGTKFDKPGKSPFMDMDLVPVYADEAGGAAVRINPDVSQNLGVRLGPVERKVLSNTLDVVGTVAFDQRLLEVVQARVEGYVTKLYVKAPLERVRRGQPIAEILAPEWLAAQQDYIALLDAQTPQAQAIREAARERLVVLGVPQATIKQIERERKANPTTTIFAPIDGVISELAVREGAAFMPGAPLVRINGLSTVWVNAQIPEANVALATEGAAVEVEATAYPAMTFEGSVLTVLPDVDAQTRTLTTRVAVDNRERKLAPGMFVTLEFKEAATEPQLVVPSEAVIRTGARDVVIVSRGEGGFDAVGVKVGAERSGMTTILSGLEEGQSVALSGQFLIDSEASLKSTVDRLSTQAATEQSDASTPERGSTASHRTKGIVKAISDQQITIAHEPVPSLQWPAMTMPFKFETADQASELEVGQRVRFSFIESEAGEFQLREIEPLDSPPPQATP
jgi:Cu(I)/Ag(I) efflux system membrane fusion protein